MNLSVVGTGYVGLVAGACFSDLGNQVICVDIDEHKIAALQAGNVPIHEPGLNEIIAQNCKSNRLSFTTDLAAAVRESEVIFIAVGTPPTINGDGADLSAVKSVARSIGQAMTGHRIIVTKSTVPVGTFQLIEDEIRAVTSHAFDVVSNPEFMREGAAIADFREPDRVIIGVRDDRDEAPVWNRMLALYRPLIDGFTPIIRMDPASAEMTKYAANAFLAMRVSFINEMAGLCELFRADVEKVRKGIGSDHRIGEEFLAAGVGYGGSCFPKDVRALKHMAEQKGVRARICDAVDATNQEQRARFAERVIAKMRAINGTTVAVWGLAFKGQTDDVRESPAIDCMREFLRRGLTVRAHDPAAIENAMREIQDQRVSFHVDPYETPIGADGLVVFTDSPQFRTPDWESLKSKLRHAVVFDGRNLYEPKEMARLGMEYHCIGRPSLRG